MACSLRYLGTSLPKNARSFFTTGSKKDAWLSKIFVRKIEPTKTPHSSMLSDKEVVYSLQTHNYRPDKRQEYLKNVASILELTKSEQQLSQAVELVGSWTVHVGDQDQAIHLWSFRGGFEKIDVANKVLTNNENYVKLWDEQAKLVRSRHLQYLLAFSYWPQIQLRKSADKSSNIYEMRSYSLQPGTMIEWGNNWARAINYRQNNNEAFAGFFSQIGRLYNVHHIWCYKDLTARKETRESAWRSPGWDECVAYTVPLIREMHCRILQPTTFSPTQ